MIRKLLVCLLVCTLALSLVGANAQEAVTYPMKTDVTLKIFSGIFYDNANLGYTNCNDRPITKYINEATGINAIWDTVPAGADGTQLFNTMVASGTLEDYDLVIYNQVNGSNASQYLEDGVILELNDHLASVPEYTKYLDTVPSLEKKSRTDDGKYYAFYCMRETGWANTYVGPLIRKDWLDALGLSMPTTFADWDNVLRAFNKNYDAVFTSVLSRVANYGLSGSFDAYGTFNMVPYLNDDGKVQIGQVQPQWKEYMTALNTWYKDGLIDHDLLTNDDTAVRTKALNEDTGLMILNLGSVDLLNKQAKEAGLSAEWVGCPYPTNAAGVVPWMQGNPNVAAENYNTFITSGCDEATLPVALAWINFAYSDSGFMTFNYGKEGETFDLVDGKPVLKDSILHGTEDMNTALARITGTVGSYWPIQAEGLVRQKNSEAACAAVDTWLSNNTIANHVMPSISLTQEETDKVTSITTSLNTYISEQSLKFFTGERSLNEFDQFVAEVEKVGLATYLEVYQNAVERYLKK